MAGGVSGDSECHAARTGPQNGVGMEPGTHDDRQPRLHRVLQGDTTPPVSAPIETRSLPCANLPCISAC
jgi:hypothetical protein